LESLKLLISLLLLKFFLLLFFKLVIVALARCNVELAVFVAHKAGTSFTLGCLAATLFDVIGELLKFE